MYITEDPPPPCSPVMCAMHCINYVVCILQRTLPHPAAPWCVPCTVLIMLYVYYRGPSPHPAAPWCVPCTVLIMLYVYYRGPSPTLQPRDVCHALYYLFFCILQRTLPHPAAPWCVWCTVLIMLYVYYRGPSPTLQPRDVYDALWTWLREGRVRLWHVQV